MKTDDSKRGLTKVSDIPLLKKLKTDFSPSKLQWLTFVEQYHNQPYGAEQLGFTPAQLIQCTFPHDDPGDVPFWSRSTPWLTVTLRPGYATDPKTRQPACVGYPFGVVPRHLFFYIAERVEHTKNRDDLTLQEKRTITLGESFGDFLRNIGMNPDNGSGKRSDRRRCHDQVRRTVLSILSYDQIIDHSGHREQRFLNMPVALQGKFFWNVKTPEQGSLWDSFIILSEPLYASMIGSNVPHDKLAIKALKDSALHLDLYDWCLHRGEQIRYSKTGRLLLPWPLLMMQLGTSYKHVRQFRARVIREFPTVKPFLRDMTVKFHREGIELVPGARPIIAPRRLLDTP
jgi:Plasmid encoded RepA protein